MLLQLFKIRLFQSSNFSKTARPCFAFSDALLNFRSTQMSYLTFWNLISGQNHCEGFQQSQVFGNHDRVQAIYFVIGPQLAEVHVFDNEFMNSCLSCHVYDKRLGKNDLELIKISDF